MRNEEGVIEYRPLTFYFGLDSSLPPLGFLFVLHRNEYQFFETVDYLAQASRIRAIDHLLVATASFLLKHLHPLRQRCAPGMQPSSHLDEAIISNPRQQWPIPPLRPARLKPRL